MAGPQAPESPRAPRPTRGRGRCGSTASDAGSRRRAWTRTSRAWASPPSPSYVVVARARGVESRRASRTGERPRRIRQSNASFGREARPKRRRGSSGCVDAWESGAFARVVCVYQPSATEPSLPATRLAADQRLAVGPDSKRAGTLAPLADVTPDRGAPIRLTHLEPDMSMSGSDAASRANTGTDVPGSNLGQVCQPDRHGPKRAAGRKHGSTLPSSPIRQSATQGLPQLWHWVSKVHASWSGSTAWPGGARWVWR